MNRIITTEEILNDVRNWRRALRKCKSFDHWARVNRFSPELSQLRPHRSHEWISRSRCIRMRLIPKRQPDKTYDLQIDICSNLNWDRWANANCRRQVPLPKTLKEFTKFISDYEASMVENDSCTE